MRVIVKHESRYQGRCPFCRQTMHAVTGFSLLDEPAEPIPGALTLCQECGRWCVFDELLLLAKATEADLKRIEPMLRLLCEAMTRARMASRN